MAKKSTEGSSGGAAGKPAKHKEKKKAKENLTRGQLEYLRNKLLKKFH